MHCPLPLVRAAAGALALAGLTAAKAHVTLEYPVGFAGAGYRASFQVGHGCGTSPTRQLVVEIPAGIVSARPMPKPGWALEVERGTLPSAAPDAARAQPDRVVRVVWTARTAQDMLAHEHYDEFVVQARLPAQPGLLHWPVRQVCVEGRSDWIEVPGPGQAPAGMKQPAPALQVLPASGGGHAH